jgi:spoVG
MKWEVMRMAKAQAAAPAPAEEKDALAEMNRLLFEAPIAELAESQGISIDEAVALRVEKSIEAAPLPVEVSVRPIVPQGNLKGFASVKIGAVEIDDFKVVDGKNGMFLSPPSKEAPGTRRGYRSTTRVLDRGLQERLDALTRDAYAQAVEKLVARVEALRPTPIKEQLAEAAKEAEQHNASHKAPAREKEGHDDR